MDARISEEFREKALRYTSGETIFLLDGSAAFHDARLECSTRIEQIKDKIGADVMTMIWGNDNGSVIISRTEDMRRLGDLENGMMLPTLEEVQLSAAFGASKKPLHVVIAANSPFFDNEEKLENCFRKLLAEPGVNVDVLFGGDADQRLKQMLMALQETEALRSRPETPLRTIFLNNLGGIGNVLVNAINNRLGYDAAEPDRAAAAMLRGSTEKVTLMPRLTFKAGVKE
ncbi:MAG: hypothetical protein ACAH83_14660 [Alphaproteobacteria bacterium]